MNAAEQPVLNDYQAFFAASPELLFIMRVEAGFPIVAANDSFLRGTMTRRETMLGRGIFDVFPAAPGSETDTSKQGIIGRLERIRRTGQAELMPPYRFDLPKPEAEGGGLEERHWQLSLTPVDFKADTGPRFILARSIDITERKHAEEAAARRTEQLRQLAETSTRLNTTLDVPSVLGVITVEARKLIDARHAVTTAAPMGSLQRGVQPLTVASHSDEAMVPESDAAVQSQALSVPLIGHGGARIGVIELTSKDADGFSPDDAAAITQLSQIAARAIENARLYEELRANDKRKDEFLAMLAHELRNPLAAIRNAVALGSDTDDTGDIAWAMEVIQRQIRQLSRMIDDLLDVSRLTQGMVQLRKETLDVAHTLHRAADTVKGLLDERRHRLTVDAQPGVYFVEADAVRLEQMLVNLLANAAKYTDKGGEIILRATPDGDHVVLSVKDNGAGIPPDKLPQMFELFAQGSRTLARSEGGLGIGLTVVRSLAELHGGTVHATSGGPGNGSEFSVRLPVSRVATPKPEAASADGAAPTEEAEKVRVLVVDDNEDSARAVARIISRQGYDVKVAYDGPAAVEVALAHRPRFVFLDIGLPGMNGYEVATRLRQEESMKSVLFVAVSGYGEEGDRRRSREAGFDQHLVKPVDPDTLLALMRA